MSAPMFVCTLTNMDWFCWNYGNWRRVPVNLIPTSFFIFSFFPWGGFHPSIAFIFYNVQGIMFFLICATIVNVVSTSIRVLKLLDTYNIGESVTPIIVISANYSTKNFYMDSRPLLICYSKPFPTFKSWRVKMYANIMQNCIIIKEYFNDPIVEGLSLSAKTKWLSWSPVIHIQEQTEQIHQ